MKLVTAHTSNPANITAFDERMRNISIFGNGNYILPTQQKFNCEITDNSKIRIAPGELMIEGTQINNDEYVEFSIINNGYSKQTDTIYLNYKIDESGIESIEMLYAAGGADGNASIQKTGSILKNDSSVIIPIYSIIRIDTSFSIDSMVENFENTFNLIPKIQSGKINIEYPKSGTVVTKEINFELPFNNFPNVVICPVSSNSKSLYFSVAGITKNSFSIVMQRETAVNTSFYWIAVGD